MRYRCDHRAEELRILGTSADVSTLSDVGLTDVLDRYGCFVLHRVRFESSIGMFIERAHTAGKRVIFDTDDLLFDSSVERYLPERARRGDGVRRQRETLRLCDAVTVTTAPLAERAATLHDRVLIEPNVVSSQMIVLADAALERSGGHQPAEEVCIAYLSGSSTHDVDFLEAADAVFWALATHPNVRFTAIGPLNLDFRFERFGERVERIPIQPWEALPMLLARVSVNLAPLEGGNGFTECKSSIKYLEAGLLGVPTIASRRPDFVRVIEHGVNGFLAETPNEWREALSTLVQSSETRREIGRAAYEDVRRNHSTAARARAAQETFRAIAGNC
jgi:glycosyltransferase involved in cell wall biosynthesis